MPTIKGEYWIIDGSVNYADGDVGDTNHEGYALDHLRRTVLDAVGIDAGDEYDWDRIVADIPEAILDSVDFAEMPDDPDPRDMLLHYAEQIGISVGDIDQAFERSAQDVRDYMAEKHGWICCHQDRFATWFLTREALVMIAEAAGEITEQEGSRCDDSGFVDHDFDFELEVFVVSTNKTYSVSWLALESGDFAEIPLQETVPDPGPNAQVAAMDRELEHPFYRNK